MPPKKLKVKLVKSTTRAPATSGRITKYPLPLTAKSMLNLISDFINFRSEGQASLLWDALGGLRGPDSINESIKAATTAIIRRKILGPKSRLRTIVKINDDTAWHKNERKAVNKKVNTESYHFVRHAKNAFVALGLKWEEVNRLED